MPDHGVFFALLMSEEPAATERRQALEFSRGFAELFTQIDATKPPECSDVQVFVNRVVEAMKPLIDYKARLGEAQESERLRSLVWPLFFEHTRHGAERWTRRLQALAGREPELDRAEVVKFWSNIMVEHARFVVHLLDPNQFELIEKATNTGKVFAELTRGPGGATRTTLREPGAIDGSLIQNPETDAVLGAAQTMLDFKTEFARNIEAARIKSIIEPRLADHVCREALKFIDELKRAV